MKKPKLELKRETVRALQDTALENIVGGSSSDDGTWASMCGGASATCVPTDRCLSMYPCRWRYLPE